MVTLIKRFQHHGALPPWVHGEFFFRVPGYGGVAGGTLRRAEGDASLGLGGAEESRSRVAKKL